MTTTPHWNDACQAVKTAQKILLVTHVQPDGDAVGSMLGLTHALRERGKHVDAVVDGGVPTFLNFVPGSETVLKTLESGTWDLLIALDASDTDRIGKSGAYGLEHSKNVINLDHHPTNVYFGDIHLVVPEAVSAAEIVFDWFVTYMQHTLSKETATALLTGLVTDTLGFRTNNVTRRTLSIAQQLMEAGASLAEVTARALNSTPYNYIRLWKRAMPTVKLKGGIVAAQVTQKALKSAGLTDVTDGGLVSVLNRVNEAVIAVIFKELPDGNVELSLRAKPGYDVAEVAFGLGGGGHTLAAGATVDGPLEAAQERVMPLLRAAVKNGKRVIA